MTNSRPSRTDERAPDPGENPPQADPPVQRLRKLVRLMDDAVEVPLLGFRVGLDALLGLVPGAGDIAGAAVSGWTVVVAARLGASASVVARMLLNIGIDALGGALPVVGDLFDVAFKANRRNLRIVEEHVLDPASTRRRSRAVVWGAVGGVLGLLAALVWAVARLASLALGLL